MPNYYLAIGIGASSGRHILFWLENGHMLMKEIYRFPNCMEERNGSLCWDYPALEQHILAGMKRCAEMGEIPVSMGIDTWGVDFVLLDGNDSRFLSPKSMIPEIQAACQESGQPVPKTPAQLAAVVYRSLAYCYREAVSELGRSKEKIYTSVSIIGGGRNAEYLNRLTAEQTRCTVYSGPAEATAIGNAMAQMLHSGELNSVEEAKKIIRLSFNVTVAGETRCQKSNTGARRCYEETTFDLQFPH